MPRDRGNWFVISRVRYTITSLLGWRTSFVIPRTSLHRGSLNRGSAVSSHGDHSYVWIKKNWSLSFKEARKLSNIGPKTLTLQINELHYISFSLCSKRFRSARSRHFSLFGGAKIGPSVTLVPTFARSKNEKFFKPSKSRTETLATQTTYMYLFLSVVLLSRGACQGFGTFMLNSSHRFLSGGIVYDSVISVFIPLKWNKNTRYHE